MGEFVSGDINEERLNLFPLQAFGHKKSHLFEVALKWNIVSLFQSQFGFNQ